MKPSVPLLLAGRVALVTGASRGIGRALALGLAQAGAKIAVNFLSGESAAQAVVREITASGGQAMIVRADISRCDEHSAMLAAVRARLGPVEILVNNAAVDQRANILEFTPANWEHILGVNLRGIFFLTQEVARGMIAAGLKGRIINVSSTHETRPLHRDALYNISKGGLAMLTRSFALELAPHGITVNSLVPGAIRTDINRDVLADPDYASQVMARIPLGYIAEPAELAAAAVFLAGPGAAYMTGSNLTVDGGISL